MRKNMKNWLENHKKIRLTIILICLPPIILFDICMKIYKNFLPACKDFYREIKYYFSYIKKELLLEYNTIKKESEK